MYKPLPHQIEGVKLIETFNRRVLLADDTGVGKTYTTLEWVRQHIQDVTPVLIVCPATMKSLVWEDMAREIGLSLTVLSSTQSQPIQKKTDLIIINYEILSYWIPILEKVGILTLVLDECHYVKNRKAKRTKAVTNLSKKIPYIIAVGATPLLNRPIELWPILHILLPGVFPFFKFALRYCGAHMTPFGWDFNGATNLKELHDILKSLCMIRRLKKDTIKIKEKRPTKIITLPIDNREEYEEAKHDIIKWMQETLPQRHSIDRRTFQAKQLVKITYLTQLAAKGKIVALKAKVDQWLQRFPDRKIALYGKHVSILEDLYQHYQPMSVLLYGKTSATERRNVVYQIQNDPAKRVFVGNIIAAGTGITLTAIQTLAFVELDFVPGNLKQVEDRIHRYGQTKRIQVVYFVATDTIEEKLCKLVQTKMRIIDVTLNGNARNSSMNLFKLLQRELQSRPFELEDPE